MEKIDDELIKGCQRYLNELERRSLILEKEQEELRREEKQKKVRREYWRKLLYETDNKGIIVIIPNDSKTDK